MVSCGSDTAPVQRALLSGLFINAAILLPDSKSQMLSNPPVLSCLQDCHEHESPEQFSLWQELPGLCLFSLSV